MFSRRAFPLLSGVSLCCALGACAPKPIRPTDQLMDEIEHKVMLPAKADPYDHYARYYASVGPNQVAVTYEIPQPAVAEMARPTCKNYTNVFPCGANHENLLLKAGQRLWLVSPWDLPATSGGGCAVIRFRYDLKLRRATAPECNGPF